ncbi:MAG: hypothetical protein IRZ11_01160 [Clostridia bacterium]|nr:hypothetical protein [Clostridia bacterium]
MKDVLWAIALLGMLFVVFGAFGVWLGRRPATGPSWGRSPGRIASLAAGDRRPPAGAAPRDEEGEAERAG